MTNKRVADAIAGIFADDTDADCWIVFCGEEHTDSSSPADQKASGSSSEAGEATGEAGSESSEDSSSSGKGSHCCQEGQTGSSGGYGKEAESVNNESDCTAGEPSSELSEGPSSCRDGQAVSICDHENPTPATPCRSQFTETNFFGDPLPGHRLILRHASERFRAELERWRREGEPRFGSLPAAPCSPGAPPRALPQLRVQLNSESEVPATRAAIRFAYTGKIEADSIREALEVRWQGAYLQMDGCAAACDEVIAGKLAQMHFQESVENAGLQTSDIHDCSGQGREATKPPVIDLYQCEELWPDPNEEPGFACILRVAQPLLVAHFGDALSVLNTPWLLSQLLSLPAVAVEILLQSDDFGTDTESTVLLLLATWMTANYDSTSFETRKRLCRNVRLHYLCRPYHEVVLPALAYDFSTNPEQSAGWLPLGLLDAARIAGRARDPDVLAGKPDDRLQFSFWGQSTHPTHPVKWHEINITPRRQCLPPSGISLTWHISAKQLRQGLMSDGFSTPMPLAVFSGGAEEITYSGFRWRLGLRCRHDGAGATISLSCGNVPSVFMPPGSFLEREGIPPATASFALLIGVQRLRGRKLERLQGTSCSLALPLLAGGDLGGAKGRLAPWAEYIRDGKITGTLTLLPIPAGTLSTAEKAIVGQGSELSFRSPF